jgi:hypothetical protein
MFHIPGIDVSVGYGSGLAATNAMAVTGIKATQRLLAVISFGAGGLTPIGRDVADFTVAAGTITAGTIDLSNLKFVAIWTSVAGS